MLRIVLDTNIYISAILFGGKPEEIINLSKAGNFEIIISEDIIFEITEVLRRKFDWKSWRISQVIDEIRELTTLIIPSQELSLIKNDNDDNRIIECAIEGNAEYIISGDKHHLLSLKEYKNIKILNPNDFVEFFEK